MTLPGRGSITLQIWDTAGQERFKSMAVSFYRGADACVLCYDITDPKSFTNLEMWMQEFTEATDIDKDKFPFIVLGNKADKPEEERQIEKSKAEAWCKGKNNIPIFETSAISKLNLDEAFDVVAQAAGRGELIPQGVALASVADLEQKENDEEKLEEEDPEPEEQEAKPPSKAIIKRDGKKGRRAASQANASPRHKKGASRAARRAPLPESSESDSETDSAGLHSRHGRSDRPSRRASPNDDRDHHRGGGTRSRGRGGACLPTGPSTWTTRGATTATRQTWTATTSAALGSRRLLETPFKISLFTP